MIWRGLAVGVLISAPMGPVGILCIQRTLDKGRKAGFYTGIGAALSDLFYCLLTGFGLSFIEDFLNDNQNVIQLLGSVVLIAFSIYLFRKNPSSSLRRPVPRDVSVKKNILGGFLFTFSNPLIIFLIIGLFARFNFTSPEIKGGFYAVGYLFIIIGALIWWYGVTYLIDKVRGRFNMRSMKRMNIAIGIVILAFACVGIVTSVLGLLSPSAQARRLVPDPAEHSAFADSLWIVRSNTEDSDLLIPLWHPAVGGSSVAGDFEFDFRVANYGASTTGRRNYKGGDGKVRSVVAPPWGIVLRYPDDTSTIVSIHNEEYSHTPLSSQTAMRIEVSPAGGLSCTRMVENGISLTDSPNHFRLSQVGGVMTLRLGNRRLSDPIILRDAADGSLTAGVPSEISLLLTPGAGVRIGCADMKVSPLSGRSLRDPVSARIYERPERGRGVLGGSWQLLDYNLDDETLRLGGDYVLDMMASGHSDAKGPHGRTEAVRDTEEYEMVYLSGATTCAGEWTVGMIKGRLTPTGIEGVWDVEWLDAEGVALRMPVKAQLESPGLLVFSFPRQNSSLRFVRLPHK